MRKHARTLAVAGLLWTGLAAASAFAQAPAAGGYEAGMAHYDAGRYADALAAFTKAAHEGDLRSQEIAGLMHLLGPRLYGDAVAEDRAAAARWLGLAAGQGSDVAVLLVRRIGKAPAAVAERAR